MSQIFFLRHVFVTCFCDKIKKEANTKQSVGAPEVSTNNIKPPETQERVCLKTLKVPFWKISFGYSNVSITAKYFDITMESAFINGFYFYCITFFL
ncbi:MAG: hypothetical protein ABIQ88_09195 [Chitinophagaceae bacterium]